MKKEFYSFEISLALKELGFDEECLGFYNTEESNEFISFCVTSNSTLDEEHLITAPLYQQAIDFLLIHYNIFITILRAKDGFVFIIPELESNAYNEVIYETLYLCREQSILKAIELCQKRE